TAHMCEKCAGFAQASRFSLVPMVPVLSPSRRVSPYARTQPGRRAELPLDGKYAKPLYNFHVL
ncbi:MAG: hypothetical protein P8Y03_28005, partial [Anaerolineales bacterium]